MEGMCYFIKDWDLELIFFFVFCDWFCWSLFCDGEIESIFGKIFFVLGMLSVKFDFI